jgi:trehalose 6-phosphate synthase/phosphatase
VNGRFGTAMWTPIHYLYRSITPQHVAALYRAADVMLVTPLRDGMNLVAKEFVAARDDEDGVLVLSEFAGAAAEMGDALLVNPFDIDGMAKTMVTALEMSARERGSRMRELRRRVFTHDVHAWARSFVGALSRDGAPPQAAPIEGFAAVTLRLVAAAREASEVVLLLDYDGTLVPVASTPDLAVPDEELLELLAALARQPRTRVHLVTGRTRESIERWFGSFPIGLHAEHGFWSRMPGSREWVARGRIDDDLKRRVAPILQEFAARTPGAFVEEKTASLAWHYRLADPEFGLLQARELRVHLTNAFSNAPVEVLPGDRVVEVRSQGVHKGRIVGALELAQSACVVAMGNDPTDEDLFQALPASALTIHIGRGATRARFRLASPAQARAVLRALLSH